MQIFYTVRQNDTLYSLANRWGIPLISLIAANFKTPPYAVYPLAQLTMPQGINTIKVVKGDTIHKLSQKYNIPSQLIIETNQLVPPYLLTEGQVLTIPEGLPYYIVRPNDTLVGIAKKYHVATNFIPRYDLLMQVNHLVSPMLIPGMKLLIPYAPLGDFGTIAYNRKQGDSYDIWLYYTLNGKFEPLTTHLATEFSEPFWSYDGQKIAFVGKDSFIYLVELATKRVEKIEPVEEFTYLSWSHDNKKLVYSKKDHISIYHLDQKNTQIINIPNTRYAQWFPNDVLLLYEAPDPNGVSQIYSVRTDETAIRQITNHQGGLLNEVKISPDGTFVLYTTPGASVSIIHTVEIASGLDIEFFGGPQGKNYNPEWSPDSSKIAYSATTYEGGRYYSQIRTVGRRGENDIIYAISSCFSTPVSWSSSGSKIAYYSNCDEEFTGKKMWSIDVNNPFPVNLLINQEITSLSWSKNLKNG